MATVRITQTLIDDVHRQARETFGDPPTIDKFVDITGLGDRLYEKLFAKWLTHMNALPECFFINCEEIYVVSIGGADERFTLPFTTRRPIPTELDSVTRDEIGLSSYRTSLYSDKVTISLKSGVFPELESMATAFTNAVKEYESEQRAFLNSIKTILSKHSTLKPALKEWPPLWDLLDDTVKERHKRVVSRKNKPATDQPEPEPELAMDLDKMTAKVIAAKVRG